MVEESSMVAKSCGGLLVGVVGIFLVSAAERVSSFGVSAVVSMTCRKESGHFRDERLEEK